MILPDAYTALKALHVAAAMVFVGGVTATAMLLPAAERMTLAAKPIARMAMRWSRRVTTPAMLLVWSLGLALAYAGGWFGEPWLDGKLLVVVALSALHGIQSGALRRWVEGRPPHPALASPKGAAIALVCAATIAILAVAKPG